MSGTQKALLSSPRFDFALMALCAAISATPVLAQSVQAPDAPPPAAAAPTGDAASNPYAAGKKVVDTTGATVGTISDVSDGGAMITVTTAGQSKVTLPRANFLNARAVATLTVSASQLDALAKE